MPYDIPISTNSVIKLDDDNPETYLQALRSVLEAGLPSMHARNPLASGHEVLVVIVQTLGTSPVMSIGARKGTLKRMRKELGCIPYRPDLTLGQAMEELVPQVAGNAIGMWLRCASECAQEKASRGGSVLTRN